MARRWMSIPTDLKSPTADTIRAGSDAAECPSARCWSPTAARLP